MNRAEPQPRLATTFLWRSGALLEQPLDNRFGPIAVVHIEVDDGHAPNPSHPQRMERPDADIVEEAESARHCVRQ